MSKHLFGLVVTHYGQAANNRGETDGNITNLQKILWKNEPHTTVSAEAIRWAIRYLWQRRDPDSVNRFWNHDENDHEWRDSKWKGWNPDEPGGKIYTDDDVLGFMEAMAASKETDEQHAMPQRLRELRDEIADAEGEQDTKREAKARKDLEQFEKNIEKLGAKWADMEATDPKDAENVKRLAKEIKDIRRVMKLKGVTLNRRGALEVTRAVSLSPFEGEITFNAKSGEKTETSLYATEVHATRYQYGFALTPERPFLRDPSRVFDVIDAVIDLSEVGGNNSRFLYDFAPDSVIFRWTDDFAPRMLYGFEMDPEGNLSIPAILRKVEDGDIKADELFIGGAIVRSLDDKSKELLNGAALGNGAKAGVKAAADALKQRIRADLNLTERA
ncbi:MAG: type I-B CRISPR-associated protein Cas7/Cst2/DevR [Acidobacteria bacterium]|nr:MAG: type I-B CRISPR-associated protein Cas7/Cst2/DevR [Acidobacteriota bacterium]